MVWCVLTQGRYVASATCAVAKWSLFSSGMSHHEPLSHCFSGLRDKRRCCLVRRQATGSWRCA